MIISDVYLEGCKIAQNVLLFQLDDKEPISFYFFDYNQTVEDKLFAWASEGNLLSFASERLFARWVRRVKES